MSCISAPAQWRASIARNATLRQRKAHLIGVVRRDAGRSDLLQQDGFKVGQMHHAAGDVDDRFAGADPVALADRSGRHRSPVPRRSAAVSSQSSISRGAEITGRRRNTA